MVEVEGLWLVVVVVVQVTFPTHVAHFPLTSAGSMDSRHCHGRVTRRVFTLTPQYRVSHPDAYMPPRRSTRSSTRLSTEPESNPPPKKQAVSSKRKRYSGDNTDTEGQEDPQAGKPPSRTTRRPSSKAAPSVPAPRVSSRSKSVPHKVPDSDGEDDDEEVSHPTKRSRSSHVLEDVHEENEEEDTKPIIARTRRAGSKPAISSATGKTGKEQIVPAEDESEEHVTAKPTSRTRSPGKDGSSSKPSTSRRSGRSTRSAVVSVKAEPLDEPSIDDVDGGEIEVPATSQRRVTKRSSRKVKSLSPLQSIGKEDSGSDTNIGETTTAIVPNGEVADVLAEKSTPAPSPKKLPSTTPPVHEEKSLLDDLPTSPLKTRRPPLPLEELQGPGSRLVIHKLVLVNFKSYAGCQEIGPFHKVSCFHCFHLVRSKLIPCSLSLRSSGLMVLASQIPLMRYSLCSGTVPARCDRENFPNSYTTLRNIRICRSAVWKFISAKLSTLCV